MIQEEVRRNAGSPQFCVVAEANALDQVTISVFRKLNNELGYWHVPPEALTLPIDAQGDLTDFWPTANSRETHAYKDFVMLGMLANLMDGLGAKNASDATRDTAWKRANQYDDVHQLVAAKEAEARAERDALRRFRETATLDGLQDVGGRYSHILSASGLDQRVKSEEGEFVINDMTLLVDAQTYVVTGMEFYGESETGGGTEDNFHVRQYRTNFQQLEGAALLLPKNVEMQLQLGHVNNAASSEMQHALEEAREQLAQLEAMKESGQITTAQYDMIMSQLEVQFGLLDAMGTEGISVNMEFFWARAVASEAELEPALKEAAQKVHEAAAGGAVAAGD